MCVGVVWVVSMSAWACGRCECGRGCKGKNNMDVCMTYTYLNEEVKATELELLALCI